MKKILSVALAAAMTLSLAACGGTPASSASAPSSETPSASAPAPSAEAPAPSSEAPAPSTVPATDFTAAMVTDVGGVNDQSFNQSAWEGLKSAETALGIKATYIESKQEADYGPNLDKLADGEHDIIWAVGFMLQSAIADAASKNPDRLYALVDEVVPETPENTISVLFRAQEPSFLVGYIAGKMTKTNQVGFVGGVKGPVIDQFEYGFRAGVAHAAKELGKEIKVDIQYAESFGDAAIGKSIALKQYADGCDIIFHAAGNVGTGVIEAAKEQNKWVIGVDRDQNYLAPENVITSAMKLVGKAMEIVTTDVHSGKALGGQTLSYGIKEGCAGIAPTSDKNVPADVLEATKKVEAAIVDGTIVPPTTQEAFDAFVK